MGYRPFEVDLSGRIALVTRANSGMGKETAREIARMGAEVILGCRSKVRGEAARSEIIETTRSSGVTVMEVDLSSLASVRAFARALDERFPKLDVLVNNAAASLGARQITSEGFERHWATSVLGADGARRRGHGLWLAASPEVEGITGKFWNKRREVRCRFRDKAAVEPLWTLVEQQTAATALTVP